MADANAIAENILFGAVHPKFYEPLSSYEIQPAYLDLLVHMLPSSWSYHRSDVWLHARKSSTHASTQSSGTAQGFKIHVSSTPAVALRVLELVAPICAADGIEFKIAGDPALLNLLNAKNQLRGSSGKFMTIYPPDTGCFTELIERLYEATRREPLTGPYILSDRRYRDSEILYYRYGGFYPPSTLNPDGTRTSCLVSPDGSLVPDERTPYFQLPDWVEDPFSNESHGDESSTETLLHGRYEVRSALGYSNSGGIYSAYDTITGVSTIIKEARPGTNSWFIGASTWDATDLLWHEYRILQQLSQLEFVPTPIDFFKEWQHSYLVEEQVDGITLDAYWALDENILAPYIRRPNRIHEFTEKFRYIAGQLIDILEVVHDAGVVLGDLSPRNIMVNRNSLRLWLIDFESALLDGDGEDFARYATQWGVDGFVEPNRRGRHRLLADDDFYSLALTLAASVAPMNAFLALKPTAVEEFLQHFAELGLPSEIGGIVESLKHSDLSAARSSLAQLR